MEYWKVLVVGQWHHAWSRWRFPCCWFFFRRIPHFHTQRANHVVLWCFLWWWPEHADEQRTDWPLIFNALSLRRYRSNIIMMTSSDGNIFRVTGHLCGGNSSVPGEFPAQRPVTRSFDVFFDLRLNKRLSKQPWSWWFETPSWSLWCHRNNCVTFCFVGVCY